MAEPVRKLGPSEEAEGASQFEAAQRRRAMRENSVNGGGQTSGPASAKLSAVRPDDHLNREAARDKNKDLSDGAGASGGPSQNQENPSDFVNRLREKQQKEKKAGEDEYANSHAKINRGFARMDHKAATGLSNRKKATIAATISGLIVSMILGVIALLPLKIEAMMKNITNHAFARADNAIERRGERIVLKFLAARAGHETEVVATGSIMADLFKNMRLRSFRANLLANEKIKVEGLGKGQIRVTALDGRAANYTGSLDKYIGRDLTNSDARAFIRASTRSQTYWFQFYKRHHLRQYMRNALGVRKWKIFDRRTGKAAKDELDKGLAEREVGPLAELAPKSLACAQSEGPCPTEDNNRNPDGTDKGTSGAKLPPEDTTAGNKDNQKAVDNAVKDGGTNNVAGDVQSEIQDIADKGAGAVTDASKTGVIDAVKKALTSRIASTFAKSVNIVLAVDTLSAIDHAIWNNSLGKIIAQKNALQYANVFASWAIIADQIKAGTASADEVNAAMNRTNGIEKSAAFNSLFWGKKGGQTMDPAAKVNQDGYQQFSDAYKADPLTAAIHTAMDAYRSTIHGVVKWVGDLIGNIITPILKAIPGFSDLIGSLAKYLAEVFAFLIGPVVDGSEFGAVLMNAIDAGAHVTAAAFTRDSLGGVAVCSPSHNTNCVTTYDDNSQLEQIAVQNSAALHREPLVTRIFDTNEPTSLISQVAVALPASPDEAVGNTFAFIQGTTSQPIRAFAGFIGKLFSGFTHSASAAGVLGGNDYGVQEYAFPASVFNKDIDPLVLNKPGITTADCVDPKQNPTEVAPDGSPIPGVVNLCLLDLTTVQSMNCGLDTNDTDCGVTDNSTAPTTPVVSSSPATGDGPSLAKQILASKNFSANPQEPIDTLTRESNGQLSISGVRLHPAMLAALVTLLSTHSIIASHIEDNQNVPGSPHEAGRAIDIFNFDGQPLDGKNAASDALMSALIPLSPDGTSFGNCDGHSVPTGGKNITFFADPGGCTHIHFQVP